MNYQSYDIVIVGAGITGATLASLLAKKTNLSIAILDSQEPVSDWSADEYSQRVSAINHTAIQVFQQLGIWETLCAKRVSAYTHMSVWDEASIGQIEFDAADVHLPYLGHIVENNLMQAVLLAALKEESRVTHYWPVELMTLEEQHDGLLLTASVIASASEAIQENQRGSPGLPRSARNDGSNDDLKISNVLSIKGKLVIAADGAHSWLRKAANIEISESPYHQVAIVASIKTTNPHQQIARQAFLPTGPLALLPLKAADAHSIVWSCELEKANRLLAMSDAEFCKALSSAFDFQLGEVSLTSKRISFPLVMRHAKEYVKPRLALVGDAAHTIHPLAGQGLNIAIMDVIKLVDLISQACKKSKPFYSDRLLRSYARARKAENTLVVKAMGGFKELFASQLTPVMLARSQGLRLINRCSFIKNIFIKHAMGL